MSNITRKTKQDECLDDFDFVDDQNHNDLAFLDNFEKIVLTNKVQKLQNNNDLPIKVNSILDIDKYITHEEQVSFKQNILLFHEYNYDIVSIRSMLIEMYRIDLDLSQLDILIKALVSEYENNIATSYENIRDKTLRRIDLVASKLISDYILGSKEDTEISTYNCASSNKRSISIKMDKKNTIGIVREIRELIKLQSEIVGLKLTENNFDDYLTSMGIPLEKQLEVRRAIKNTLKNDREPITVTDDLFSDD